MSERISDDKKRREARVTALGNLGIAYKDIKRWRRAITYYKETLREAQALQDRRLEANTWGNLGLAHSLQKRFYEAARCLQKQTEIALELGDFRGQGYAQVNLAQNDYDSGKIARAIEGNYRAISLLRPLEDPLIPGLEDDIEQWQRELDAQL